LLRRSHALLARLLAQLSQAQPLESVVEALAGLREFRHTSQPPAGAARTGAQPAQEGDKELLEVFLEEAGDIVESSAAALARWQ
ncbi:hypothetical protein NY486_00480, partial [Enterobacter hormaechei]|nr:hypothetical protein [Enterobacter hormaechei]